MKWQPKGRNKKGKPKLTWMNEWYSKYNTKIAVRGRQGRQEQLEVEDPLNLI